MTEQYGPPIPVNGVRPEWLRDNEMCLAITADREPQSPREAWEWRWPLMKAIRLPITHPASICQQRALDHPDEAPFYPVHADGTVPVDYDGGDVLLRDSSVARYSILLHWSEALIATIVGYRRKATTAGPMPTCAPERFAGVVDDPIQQAKELIGAGNDTLSEAAWQSNISQAWHILDRIPATYVLVERMTREEARAWWDHDDGPVTSWLALLTMFGIIKPDPDPIEALAAKYGVPVELVREIKGAVA